MWPQVGVFGFYRLTRFAGAGRGWAVLVAFVASLVLLALLGSLMEGGGSSGNSEKAAEAAITEAAASNAAEPKPQSPRATGPTAEQRDIAKRSQAYVDDARICMGSSVIAFELAGTAKDVNATSRRRELGIGPLKKLKLG